MERGQSMLHWAERLHRAERLHHRVLALDSLRLTTNKRGVITTQALFEVCDVISLICKTPL